MTTPPIRKMVLPTDDLPSQTLATLAALRKITGHYSRFAYVTTEAAAESGVRRGIWLRRAHGLWSWIGERS